MEDEKQRIIANRYKIIEKIGVGGMGDIYLASDLQLSRQVAIKTIRNELKENVEVQKRIDRECNLHATLGVHPNIVALHDRINQDGNIYLIMEYVRGETLTNRLKRNREEGQSFSTTEVVDLVCQILDALSHIHNNEILHRDIKPSNIMLVDKSGRAINAKLMDFGIAALDTDDPAVTQITTLVTGGPGTPAYMAPERIDSDTFGKSSPATDLYSVGVILYELLGDSPPFQGTMTEVFTGHLAREPNILSLSDSVPDLLLAVLRKSLQKKQEDRFHDAGSFAEALRRSIADASPAEAASEGGRHEALEQTVLATGQHLEAMKEAVASTNKEKMVNVRKVRKSRLFLGVTSLVLAAIVLGILGIFMLGDADVKAPSIAVVPDSPGDKTEGPQGVGAGDDTGLDLPENPGDSGASGDDKEAPRVFQLDPVEPPPEEPPKTYPGSPSFHPYASPNKDIDSGGAVAALLKYRQPEATKPATPVKPSTPRVKTPVPSSPPPSKKGNGDSKVIDLRVETRKLD